MHGETPGGGGKKETVQRRRLASTQKRKKEGCGATLVGIRAKVKKKKGYGFKKGKIGGQLLVMSEGLGRGGSHC